MKLRALVACRWPALLHALFEQMGGKTQNSDLSIRIKAKTNSGGILIALGVHPLQNITHKTDIKIEINPILLTALISGTYACVICSSFAKPPFVG